MEIEAYTYKQVKYIAYYACQYTLLMQQRQEQKYKYQKWNKQFLHEYLTRILGITHNSDDEEITEKNTDKHRMIELILNKNLPYQWIIKKLQPYGIDPSQFPAIVLLENEKRMSFDEELFPPELEGEK